MKLLERIFHRHDYKKVGELRCNVDYMFFGKSDGVLILSRCACEAEKAILHTTNEEHVIDVEYAKSLMTKAAKQGIQVTV